MPMSSNIKQVEGKELSQVVANAPKGEYYLYTDMAEALRGACRAADALVSMTGGGSAVVTPVSPDSASLEALADLSSSSARRGDYIDILANAAARSLNEVTLAEGDRVEVKVSSVEGYDGISVARLVISASKGTKSAAVVRLSSKGRLVVQAKVNVAEGANLCVVFLQDGESDQTLLTRTTVDMAADSTAQLTFVNLNPALARNELKCGMHAPGASFKADGLYSVTGDGRVDNETLVEHIAGHTSSDQLFKGIADGNGVMAFGGLILVKPDAQKVDANQTNRHMLASRDARAYAKPQLEIYADDVKCSHGATTGQIDPQQLFYMQQRGIDEQTARRLLSAAFVGEVVDRIPLDDIREALHERLIG